MSLTNLGTNHEVCGVIFELIDALIFPDPSLAEEDGLLAVGGDLSPERLMLAYENGIFPWYSDDTPILWYSPHQRFVLFPEKIRIARSMRQFMKKENVEIRMDTNFESVIRNCETVNRVGQDSTWITDDMRNAYIGLHKLGFAHSVETYINGELAGGLYGVQTGNIFCGESMFSLQPNASKAALIWLVTTKKYSLVDCQVHTPHLESMGAEFITREEYAKMLKGRLE
jgi:leucyl/phenylalanyl-tRNA--protein transferase